MIMAIASQGAMADWSERLDNYGLNVGDTKELYVSDMMWATLNYSTTHWISTTWTTSNSSVVKITYRGKSQCTIEAVGNGEAKIEYNVHWGDAYLNWTDSKGYYNIYVEGEKITITASPNGGTVTNGTKVTLSSSPSDASIYYTLDGTTPTYKNNAYTSSGITINNDCTLKAIAVKKGYTDSNVLTAQYTVETTFTDYTVEGVLLEFKVTDVNAKTVEVSDVERGASGCVTIPAEAKGYKVTGIGVLACYSRPYLTSIIIPESVTTIGYCAFEGCSSLTSITIPETVTSIGYSAFGYCKSLTSFIIPKSVITIDDNAFYKCTSLPSITIPESVTSIGGSAFEGCTSLTSVTMYGVPSTIGTNPIPTIATIYVPASIYNTAVAKFPNNVIMTLEEVAGYYVKLMLADGTTQTDIFEDGVIPNNYFKQGKPFESMY